MYRKTIRLPQSWLWFYVHENIEGGRGRRQPSKRPINKLYLYLFRRRKKKQQMIDKEEIFSPLGLLTPKSNLERIN